MNLRLLHHGDNADRDWRMKDKLNGWSGRLQCRFLEWSGWYNYDIAQRLLGHYRLFQHFKRHNTITGRNFPVIQAYIFQYRAGHGTKYLIARLMSRFYSIFNKDSYPVVEIAAFNRMLVNEGAGILYEFLERADNDFDQAFLAAVERLNTPELFTAHPAGKAGIKGREKGVFSKKQILIMFDLLSGPGGLEKIDLTRPNKFDGIAALLHAITGKAKESFLQELNDHRNNGLYAYNTPGERNQLIITLNNLSETFRAAGFRSIAKLADKKIKELESAKKDGLEG